MIHLCYWKSSSYKERATYVSLTVNLDWNHIIQYRGQSVAAVKGTHTQSEELLHERIFQLVHGMQSSVWIGTKTAIR